VVSAVLANGTLGYAADFEPHHPEAILHPVAITLPTSLAMAEAGGLGGGRALAAMLLGCEITCRVSMALDPRELYGLGFHPSAVAGTFGAVATAANLLGLSPEQTVRALGLAALQTSGLMAWQDDPREDARPFQMGMAARNGVTAALLAADGFGAPDRIFDGGHTVLGAFSRVGRTEPLTDGLGTTWDGVNELAVKPYACVSFLHPALDALASLLAEHAPNPADIAAIDLRFAEAGAHCVDDNPLKSHSAQYILPVRAALGRLSPLDLFVDQRAASPAVARLAARTTVTRDRGDFDARFPDVYAGEVTLTLADGRTVSATREIARGYPETPLGAAEIAAKFDAVVGLVAGDDRRARLAEAARGLADAPSVDPLMALLREPADPGATA
jgi:2-methylcitrate dehydratase PrpD